MIRHKIKICVILLSGLCVIAMSLLHKEVRLSQSEEYEKVDAFGRDIMLNEVCVINHYSYPNEDGDYHAWIELYNKSDDEITLSGYGLTNSLERSDSFIFGDAVIPAGGYQVVYLADARATCFDKNSRYADFQIGIGGGYLYLIDPYGEVADSVHVPELMENVSYARISDGAEGWQRQIGTPGASNDDMQEISFSGEILPVPLFSVPSGFYEKGINVRIFANGGGEKIYYTLDGSEPDESSLLYQGNIHVTDVSDTDNVYSARADISPAVYYDSAFALPDAPVDKATVIRARTYDDNGNKSPVATSVYFIGYDSKEEYNNMPIVSLVTDPSNLFDYDNGIYTLGRSYDESAENKEWDGQWQFMDANYQRRGRQSERLVHMDYFGFDKELLLSQEAGIRIKGNFSRGLVQKSFNIYARKDYGDSSSLQYPFFGNGRYYGAITLFCGGNDVRGKLMDYLAQTFAADMRFDTMAFVPCAVFLDGEYWGFYYLTEKYDTDYLEQHYGVNKDDVVMIKDKRLSYGTREDYNAYDDDMHFVQDADMTIDENYQKFCELFDRDSYIDFYAYSMWIGREGDWPGNNWAIWKTRTVSGYEKWRWMLYDLNFWCMENPDSDTLGYLYEQDEAFANLMRNAEFKAMFFNRVRELSEGIMNESNTIPFLKYVEENNRLQMEAYYNRFYDGVYTLETYEEEVSGIRNFLENRREYLERCLEIYE